MTVDLPTTNLPSNAYTPATDLARELLNKYEINAQNLKDASDTILLLRAQANVAGFNVEADLIRISNFIDRYKKLTHELHEIAGV
ncbi:MAG: hypothetical protein R3B93_27235 [Bacteroidia bacterium]